MTFAPQSLVDLGAYWVAQKGVNLGIVGDTSHVTKGTSYHLGKDDLLPGAYSVKLARDVAGLSDAASAIDLGKLGGSYLGLREFSEWLVARALTGQCPDIREIIYATPDGLEVRRWSGPDNKVYISLRKNPDGSTTVVTPGNGDASHFSHTHISYYRDSEDRDKVAAFRPYFEGVDMPGLQLRFVDRTSGIATVVGADHAIIRVHDQGFVAIPEGQQRQVAGLVTLLEPVAGHPSIGAGTPAYLIGNIPGNSPDNSVAAVLLKKDCEFAPDGDASEWEAWYKTAPLEGTP